MIVQGVPSDTVTLDVLGRVGRLATLGRRSFGVEEANFCPYLADVRREAVRAMHEYGLLVILVPRSPRTIGVPPLANRNPRAYVVWSRTAQSGTKPCVGSFELAAPTRILAEGKAFVQQLDNFELLFLLM